MAPRTDGGAIQRLRDQLYLLHEVQLNCVQAVNSAMAETRDRDRQRQLRALRDALIAIRLNKLPEVPI